MPGDWGDLIMFNAGALAFQEFVMGESLPLATIQQAVFEFLRGRDGGAWSNTTAVTSSRLRFGLGQR